MEINEELLKNFQDNDLPIVKLILFSIQEDLQLGNFLENQKNVVSIKDDIYNSFQRISTNLIARGVINVSYSDNGTKLSLNRPLYVNTNLKFSHDVDQIRKFFSKRYCGLDQRNVVKSKVEELLSDFMRLNPQISFDDIVSTCKEMVDYHLHRGSKFIPGIDKYIQSPKGLLLDIEEKKFDLLIESTISDLL